MYWQGVGPVSKQYLVARLNHASTGLIMSNTLFLEAIINFH